MKFLLTLSICLVIIGIGYYSYSHIRRERSLKQLVVPGVKRQAVVELLGPPLSSQQLEEIDTTGNFNRYQKKTKGLTQHENDVVTMCTTKEVYNGHKCLVFCPNYFEDQFIVYYNQEGIACKVERIGL
jgi:hypothetical protein